LALFPLTCFDYTFIIEAEPLLGNRFHSENGVICCESEPAESGTGRRKVSYFPIQNENPDTIGAGMNPYLINW